MPSPPSHDTGDELTALRARVAALAAENASLRERLTMSDEARADLLDQAEHTLELLRRALRENEYHRSRQQGG